MYRTVVDRMKSFQLVLGALSTLSFTGSEFVLEIASNSPTSICLLTVIVHLPRPTREYKPSSW